jgi:gas vesicle protein
MWRWRVVPLRVAGLMTAAVTGAALLLGPSDASAQGRTQKISKDLVQRAEEMVKELGKTRSQVVKTVRKYDDLFSKKSVKDRQNAYKDLTKEIKNTEDRVKDARKRSDTMHKEAEKFFNEWVKGLAKVNDTQLRALSQANMNESRDAYYQIIDSGLKAATLYGGFVTDLKNQCSYLNLDMSDTAMSRLTANRAQVTAGVSALYQAVDELTGSTKRYIASMK